MPFAPSSPQSTPQTPNFAPQQQAQVPMQQNGKPTKPVVHGLLSAEDIDSRISQMPREAQAIMMKAITAIPALPTIMGIAIGPEAHDYFQQAAEDIKRQSAAQQQNSPQDASGAPSGQNPSSEGASAPDAGGQPPAMATPPAAPMA